MLTRKMICGAWNQGKKVKVQHKKVFDVQTLASLDLVHIDLMGPMQTKSIAEKNFVYVLVDDYTKFTWEGFIKEKSETAESIKTLQLINEKGRIKKICSDHKGSPFLMPENDIFFCRCAINKHRIGDWWNTFHNSFTPLLCEARFLHYLSSLPESKQFHSTLSKALTLSSLSAIWGFWFWESAALMNNNNIVSD